MPAPLSSLSADALRDLAAWIGGDPFEPSAPADWVLDPAVFERLRSLAIAPPVAYALAAHRAAPADSPWAAFAAEQAMRNHVLLIDAGEVSAALRSEGIPSVFIKGAALLATACPAPARHLDDIDIIVPPHLAARARDVLLAAGFVTESRFEAVAFDGRSLVEHHARDHHAEIGLVSPLGTAVDIHRHVAEHPDWTFEVITEAAIELTLDTGGTILVPSAAWQMRIICDHILDHHDGVLRYWPRHLFDIGALVHRFGDAVDTPDAAVQASLAAWGAVQRWPAWSGALVAPAASVDRLSEVAANAVAVATRNARQLRSDPSRVARKVVPARAAIAAQYETTATDPRLPLLYVHRLATLRFLRRPEGA